MNEQHLIIHSPTQGIISLNTAIITELRQRVETEQDHADTYAEILQALTDERDATGAEADVLAVIADWIEQLQEDEDPDADYYAHPSEYDIG